MFVQTLDPDPNPLSMGKAQTRDRDNRVSFRAVPRPHGSYIDLDLASLTTSCQGQESFEVIKQEDELQFFWLLGPPDSVNN